MNTVEKMRLQDTKKKNILMFIVFSVSLVAAFAKSFFENNTEALYIFGAEIIVFSLLFVGLQFLLKKYNLFPYLAVTLTNVFTMVGVFFAGGGWMVILVTYFLTIFSVIHFKRIVFAIGYILGMTTIILTLLYGTKETASLATNAPTIFLTYLLSGVLLGVFDSFEYPPRTRNGTIAS